MFGVLAGLLLFTILPIAVIIGAVSATMRARRADLDEDEGIGSVRRLFIYALALIGVTFAAVGISMITEGTLDALVGDVLLLERREGLAVALAFTVVGTPAWLLFMLLAQRSVASHAVERRSQARRLYFALARTIAVSVAAWGAIDSRWSWVSSPSPAGRGDASSRGRRSGSSTSASRAASPRRAS